MEQATANGSYILPPGLSASRVLKQASIAHAASVVTHTAAAGEIPPQPNKNAVYIPGAAGYVFTGINWASSRNYFRNWQKSVSIGWCSGHGITEETPVFSPDITMYQVMDSSSDDQSGGKFLDIRTFTGIVTNKAGKVLRTYTNLTQDNIPGGGKGKTLPMSAYESLEKLFKDTAGEDVWLDIEHTLKGLTIQRGSLEQEVQEEHDFRVKGLEISGSVEAQKIIGEFTGKVRPDKEYGDTQYEIKLRNGQNMWILIRDFSGSIIDRINAKSHAGTEHEDHYAKTVRLLNISGGGSIVESHPGDPSIRPMSMPSFDFWLEELRQPRHQDPEYTKDADMIAASPLVRDVPFQAIRYSQRLDGITLDGQGYKATTNGNMADVKGQRLLQVELEGGDQLWVNMNKFTGTAVRGDSRIKLEEGNAAWTRGGPDLAHDFMWLSSVTNPLSEDLPHHLQEEKASRHMVLTELPAHHSAHEDPLLGEVNKSGFPRSHVEVKSDDKVVDGVLTGRMSPNGDSKFLEFKDRKDGGTYWLNLKVFSGTIIKRFTESNGSDDYGARYAAGHRSSEVIGAQHPTRLHVVKGQEASHPLHQQRSALEKEEEQALLGRSEDEQLDIPF